MTTVTSATGQACIDCTLALTNGVNDVEGPEAGWYDAYLAALLACEEQGIQIVLSCDDDCENGFSADPCDVCKSRLGGYRHSVTFHQTEGE